MYNSSFTCIPGRVIVTCICEHRSCRKRDWNRVTEVMKLQGGRLKRKQKKKTKTSGGAASYLTFFVLWSRQEDNQFPAVATLAHQSSSHWRRASVRVQDEFNRWLDNFSVYVQSGAHSSNGLEKEMRDNLMEKKVQERTVAKEKRSQNIKRES